MKTTTKMRKITVRRTGDIRLTTAPCDCPYVARDLSTMHGRGLRARRAAPPVAPGGRT